jgi:hypothetical protein
MGRDLNRKPSKYEGMLTTFFNFTTLCFMISNDHSSKHCPQSNVVADQTYFACSTQYFSEPGSSVSIVSGYGLHDRAIEVRSPAEAKDFSSNFCVQTGSGAHPASCTMGTGGKARPGRDADQSPPSSAEVENE